MHFYLAVQYFYQKKNIQQPAIFPFVFLRKDRKFVCMDNACIMALGLIRPELINMNITLQ